MSLACAERRYTTFCNLLTHRARNCPGKLPLKRTWISLLGRAPVRAPLAAWSTILNKSNTSTCNFCCAWYVSSGMSPVKKCSLSQCSVIFTQTRTHPATRLFMLGACSGGQLDYSGIIQQLPQLVCHSMWSQQLHAQPQGKDHVHKHTKIGYQNHTEVNTASTSNNLLISL